VEETPTPEPAQRSPRTLSRRAQLAIAASLLLLFGGSWFNWQVEVERQEEWKLQGVLGELRLAHSALWVARTQVRGRREMGFTADLPKSEAKLRAAEARVEAAEAQTLELLVKVRGLSQEEAKTELAFRRARSEAQWHGWKLVR